MNTILDVGVMKDYIRMCQDAADQGWHERNGGNLSYRMTPEEVNACREYFRAVPGDWVEMGVSVPNLAGEYFIVTGSGKFLRNVSLAPQNNICIAEVDAAGEAYRIVWGLEEGGTPTSEVPTHMRNHAVRTRVTGGKDRVIYHAHTPYVIALTHVLPAKTEVFTRMLWKSATECCVVFPEGVGVVPWMIPGGTDIAAATCELMEHYPAAVWTYHGMFVSGETFDLAFGLMHTIEKAAEICALALAASGGKPLQQGITDDNLRAIGAAFGVTLNEEILTYHSDEMFS